MKADSRTPDNIPCVVVADPTGGRLIVSALSRVGIDHPILVPPSKGWAKQVALANRQRSGTTIVVPSSKFGPDIVPAMTAHLLNTSAAVVWSSGASPSENATHEPWLIEQLLRQQGAFITPDLSVLSSLACLLELSARIPFSGVHVRGRRTSVHERLKAHLSHNGVCMTKGKERLLLDVDETGGICCHTDFRKRPLGDPSAVASAVSMLVQRLGEVSSSIDIAASQTERLSLILAPPRRLLSETVSKQVLTAYGTPIPKERLCKSPSEAARFAATLPGPAVMKLVKPELEGKLNKGAVIRNVSGNAAVRRAAQTLEGLGYALGPPAPLGILVSEQLSTDTAIWLEMIDHPRFGRLVAGGPGLHKQTPYTFALNTPATPQASYRALLASKMFESGPTTIQLSRGISRFTHMVHDLGSRVFRAEIHPLVVDAVAKEPVALDALVEIADA